MHAHLYFDGTVPFSDVAVRLLLIEDNPGDALIFREKLGESDLDFELVHTQRLQDGCDMLEEETFDIILVDLSLPDASGLEAVVRVVDVAKETPVVVLTGLDDASMAAQARHEGAIDYLVKWYQDSQTMARYIRYAIAQRRMDGEEAETPPEPEAPQSQPVEQAPQGPTDGSDPLRAALDPHPDGILVVRADGTIEYANSRAAALVQNATHYPWSLRTGIARISVGNEQLVQQAAPTRWHGREAFVITLRASDGDHGVTDGALIEAAEASVTFLAQSERRLRWMSGLVRTALDLEQQHRAGIEPAPTVLNIVEAINSVTRELRPLALERGMPINVRASREKIATTMDRRMLETLLRRLLLDSLLTASGSSVEVEVQQVSGEPQINVSWDLSVADWTALPENARSLSRRVLEGLVNQSGGTCRFDQEGSRDVVRVTLPPGSAANA